MVRGVKMPSEATVISKNLQRMRSLGKCQANFMNFMLKNIDRKSKPIKKQYKYVRRNLRRHKLYLTEENFDIIKFINE